MYLRQTHPNGVSDKEINNCGKKQLKYFICRLRLAVILALCIYLAVSHVGYVIALIKAQENVREPRWSLVLVLV